MSSIYRPRSGATGDAGPTQPPGHSTVTASSRRTTAIARLVALFATTSRADLVAIIHALLVHDQHAAALLSGCRDADLHRLLPSDAASSVPALGEVA